MKATLNDTFCENLIKGVVTQTIFRRMFVRDNSLEVFNLGYENTIPELLHSQGHKSDTTALKKIRKLPDFALRDKKDKSLVYLVEVKYRSKVHPNEMLEIARELTETGWGDTHLFVACPECFYFENIKKILENNGQLKKLEIVTEDLQAEYLVLLNKYISHGK